MKPGIDVSHWNGNINWATCRQNVSFALLKCTQGNGFYDHTYVYNKLGAETNKIPHGAYHYFLPAIDGALQADWFYQKANDAALKVWVIDVEAGGTGLEANLEKMIDRLIELTTCMPWIYTSAGFWNGNINHALTHPCPLWVANYTTLPSPAMPHGWDEWKIWQYTDKGTVPGIIGNVDMNLFNGDENNILDVFGNGEIIIPPPLPSDRVMVDVDVLNLRNAPVVSPATIVGQSMRGHVWDVTGRVRDSQGREWVQSGPTAHLAAWLCRELRPTE
jgi:lysozyme